MIDKTHSPRKVIYSIEALESLLDAALEHASHGWHALERETQVNRINGDGWPPRVEAEVGSAQYHLSIVIVMLYEVYSSTHAEAEKTREVMEKVEEYLRKHGKES
jgi:hypothetical protein